MQTIPRTSGSSPKCSIADAGKACAAGKHSATMTPLIADADDCDLTY